MPSASPFDHFAARQRISPSFTTSARFSIRTAHLHFFRKLCIADTPACEYYSQYIEHCQEVDYDKIEKTVVGGAHILISYRPFYSTLFKKNITEYNLIYRQGLSANTIHRIKHGEAISTRTLDTLCYILDCRVEDIIEFVKE